MRNTFLISTILFCQLTATAQNVGIGTNTPTGPLSFGPGKSYVGDRTIVFDDGKFGIGTAGNDMFFSVGPTAGSVVFGQGNSSAFTPVMRIQSDGNVGIGVSQATHALDVGNRIRSRWSGTTLTPGIITSYIDGIGNVLPPLFTGMADNNSIAMIGGGSVVLRYDGRYGALGLNQNYGFNGQVAISNGNTNTATWQNLPDIGFTYKNTAYYYEFNSYTLSDASPTATLNAFTIPMLLSNYSNLFIDYSIAANTTACSFCGPTYFKVDIRINGVLRNSSVYEVGNGRSTTACDGMLMAGGTNPTISVVVTKLSGPNLNLPASAGRTSSITIWPVPEK